MKFARFGVVELAVEFVMAIVEGVEIDIAAGEVEFEVIVSTAVQEAESVATGQVAIAGIVTKRAESDTEQAIVVAVEDTAIVIEESVSTEVIADIKHLDC
mmetsp:Transcript_56018/g.77193  ORF Transcript_56018/g.77193 Transcript_56018/m.77193 type:complete len:100 (+) Transcript_56018:3-302(+)